MRILDVGSGPVVRSKSSPGIDITFCDKVGHGIVDKQNMENLTYPDNSFDIVHCQNALDHTPDALAALKQLIRVAKHFVYIKCWLDQKQTGHKHYWDFKEDGIFTNGESVYDLKDYGFKIEYIDIGGERRYNYIIATLCLV